MGMPLFSCVVPVKGARPYIDVALESLRLQGMGDELEIIVQDGDVEADVGQSDALNKGFAKARGEWLFWLNADDVLLPGALDKVRRLIDGKGSDQVNWIAGNQMMIDEGGRVIRCSVGNSWHDFLYRHSVPHVYGPSSFFRKTLYQRVGGFDVTLKFCMDWDLWIRFMKEGARYRRIDEYLWAQRQWDGSKTQRKLSASESERQQAEVRRMLDNNGFLVTAAGVWKMRLWRWINGNYLAEWMDGMRMRGNMVFINAGVPGETER